MQRRRRRATANHGGAVAHRRVYLYTRAVAGVVYGPAHAPSGTCAEMASYLVVIRILSLLAFPLAGEHLIYYLDI